MLGLYYVLGGGFGISFPLLETVFTEAETETCLRGKVLNAWRLLPVVMEERVSPLSSRSSELMQQPPLPSFDAPMYSQLPLLSFSGGPQGPGHRGVCGGVKLGWGKEEKEREQGLGRGARGEIQS